MSIDAWSCLSVEDHDAPNIWALKSRALLAGGLRAEAKLALRHVRAERLSSLPCDRDYLGTLGALTHVAVELDAKDYIEALHELLAPHQQRFAVNISFLCEGTPPTRMAAKPLYSTTR
ncbi:MAG TPA: hypothetical protein VFN67_29150 [Polyangiales bacterium]|nr:hypothetical protein [Polyangiales bacterium]